AKVWLIADERLATHRFFEGDTFTLADIAVGAFARRWLGFEGVSKPKLSHLDRVFAQMSERPGFQRFAAPPISCPRRLTPSTRTADVDADGAADLHTGVG